MKTMKRPATMKTSSDHDAYVKGKTRIHGLARLLGVLAVVFLVGPHLAVAEEFRYIEPQELLKQINANADIVLLDAQPAKKYAEAHIRGAVNVAGMAQIEDLDLPYSRPLVIYCDCAGEEASRFLAARLIKNGYKQENIFILRGGWYKWLELGYPIEKGKSQKGASP